ELIRTVAAAGPGGVTGDDGDTIVATVLARDWPAPAAPPQDPGGPAPGGAPVMRPAAPAPPARQAGRPTGPTPPGGPRPPAPPPAAKRRNGRTALIALAGGVAVALAASVGAWAVLRSSGGGPGGPQGGEAPDSLSVWVLESSVPNAAEAAELVFRGAEGRYQ